MRIYKMRVTCKCGHVFDADIVVDALITVTAASMAAVQCPKCGGDKLGLGGAYDDAPPLSAPVEARAGWWRERGETGTSSLTIWSAFAGGGNPHRHNSYPLDPDDFQRCKKLLDLIPEWRRSLDHVVTAFPWFQPFVSAWPEFERLWAEESPTKRCPKLYAAMQVAGKEADALRSAA